jgi:hypothetical protein
MADFGTLFTLILVALTFVIVGMCFIVYIMIIGERDKRMRAEGVPNLDAEPEPGCPHHFGYLSGFPIDQPIPDECFGCLDAVQCMDPKARAVEAVESTEPT